MPHRRGVFPLLLSILAVPAGADVFPLAAEPVYAGLEAQLLDRSPELQAQQAASTAARARVPQAGALPDPEVQVEYAYGGRGLKPGANDDTGIGVGVSQLLPGPGKRGLLEQVAAAGSRRAEHGVQRTKLELVYRLRRAYADLLLAREGLALIEDQRRATRDIEELTRSRYAVGLAQQSDVLRAQAELARLAKMRYHEEGLEGAALAELNRLLARPAGTPLDATPRLTGLDVDAVRIPARDEVTAGLDGRNPALLAAFAMVEEAHSGLQLARRNRGPDYAVGARYIHRGSMPPMATVGVGIVIPLYKGRKQSQAVAEADARLASEKHAAAAMSLRARATVERALLDLGAAVLEARAYSEGVLKVNALAVESALASFQAGKAPFLSVLEAHNTLYRDRWEHAELLFHVLWHSASLDAMGVVME